MFMSSYLLIVYVFVQSLMSVPPKFEVVNNMIKNKINTRITEKIPITIIGLEENEHKNKCTCNYTFL